MKTTTPLRALAVAFFVQAAAAISGCDGSDPTSVVVVNAFPAPADGGDPATAIVVYKVWYATTLVSAPIAPGDSSESLRVVPGVDYAYALLAIGWDPTSGSPPTRLVPVRSNEKIGAARGETLRIVVGDGSMKGRCPSSALSQDDADFVTQRIFPGDFAGVTYDAKTCTSTRAGDAGADASDDGG